MYCELHQWSVVSWLIRSSYTKVTNPKFLRSHYHKGRAAGQVSHTEDIVPTMSFSLDIQARKSGLIVHPVPKGLTRYLPAETSGVTGILKQLDNRFL